MKRKSKYDMYLIIATVIFVIAVIVFIARPFWAGYSVYKEAADSNLSVADYSKNLKELESQVSTAEVNLSSCYFFNKNMLGQLEGLTENLLDCEVNYTKLKEKLDSSEKGCEEEKNKAESALQDKTSELAELQSDYNTLAKNTANNLCCKARIDNSRIGYYSIDKDNNKVICLEQGTQAISC
jgi:chromosome segregation ATPase